MFGFTKETDPELSSSEHELWRDFIEKKCGLYFGPTRIRYLRQCLWSRMRIHGQYNYGEYFQFITNNQASEPWERSAEWKTLLELLAIRESSFFRHRPSFRALAEQVLPDLISGKRRAGHNHLRMWSAGCSAGQETFSMAMTALESIDPRMWHLRVVGSDISRQAVARAREGIFKEHEIKSLPRELREKYTKPAREVSGNRVRIHGEVMDVVHFENRNLLEPGELRPAGWDIIFCQNLFIYLQPRTRNELFRKLCQSLSLGGYLILAPAEILGMDVAGIQLQHLQETLIHKRVS